MNLTALVQELDNGFPNKERRNNLNLSPCISAGLIPMNSSIFLAPVSS